MGYHNNETCKKYGFCSAGSSITDGATGSAGTRYAKGARVSNDPWDNLKTGDMVTIKNSTVDWCEVLEITENLVAIDFDDQVTWYTKRWLKQDWTIKGSTPKEEVFPSKGTKYWYIQMDADRIRLMEDTWGEYSSDKDCFNSNNFFLDRKEAEEKVEKIKLILK